MRNLTENLIDKKIDLSLLINYGFKLENDCYIYETVLSNNQFKMIVTLTSNNNLFSEVIDIDTEEEYSLVDVSNTLGTFIGTIREEYDKNLQDIITQCFPSSTFNGVQSLKIIEYVKKWYQTDLEFLWESSPTTAVLRNKNTNKWYGLIMLLSSEKLGLGCDKEIEVINLRYRKDKIDNIIDGKTIYAGYHMNKRNWITIRLDNTLKIDDIILLIDNSYSLSMNKK